MCFSVSPCKIVRSRISIGEQVDASDLSERDTFLRKLTPRTNDDLMDVEVEDSAADDQVRKFTRLVRTE